MIDRTAFHKLSYGLYLITSANDEGRKMGCVANTFAQIASEPPLVSVALNKQNATTSAVQESGRFVASVLSEKATMELIGAFGFRSSLEFDKFADFDQEIDESQMPCVTQTACACFSVRVTQTVDAGTHLLLIGQVEEARALSDDAPMTYAYYHDVLRGKTPPKAASYNGGSNDGAQLEANARDAESDAPSTAGGAPTAADGALAAEGAAVVGEVEAVAAAEGVLEEAAAQEAATTGATRVAWQCTLCGYIEYMDELPDDYECPICGAGKEMFERIEVPA